jgi:hypothetical protein
MAGIGTAMAVTPPRMADEVRRGGDSDEARADGSHAQDENDFLASILSREWRCVVRDTPALNRSQGVADYDRALKL